MNLRLVFLATLALTSWSLTAQTIAVMPQNVSGIGSVQVGNTVAGKCDGYGSKFVKVTVQPSCYGANLRSGGETLNPDDGDIELDLTINNASSSFNSKVTFPNKVTWPENYGQTCRWVGTEPLSTVDCDQENATVTYNCQYVKEASFLNDYLKCDRVSDPLGHGKLNSNIHCGFMYSWKGTNYAATDSYSRITSVAQCGLREKNEDWGAKVSIVSSAEAAKTTKYAKRGKLVVSFDGLSIAKQSVVKNNTTGEFMVSGQRSQVIANFSQFNLSGNRKKLSQKVEASFDEFEECLDIKAVFLGTNQFCGSYYSPIMMFFDDQRPLFAGTSSFPLVQGIKFIYWPERKAPGYFLAVDEYSTGKITNSKQLFGENGDYKNGFESLKRFDSNNDLNIDSNDKNFSKLLLWQDENGDGVSDTKELFSLESKGVVSISLKYDNNYRLSFGKRAEARQLAEFVFKKDGQEFKGKAIDVWLSPNALANKSVSKSAMKKVSNSQ